MDGLFIKYSSCENPGVNSPFVLVHGDFQNHTVFNELEKDVIARGHDVVSFDLPGHGNSPAEEYDLHNIIGEVLNKTGVENPIFVGNSFGGILSMNYAKLNPGKVVSLFLINSPIFNMFEAYPSVDWDSEGSRIQAESEGSFVSQKPVLDYSVLRNSFDGSSVPDEFLKEAGGRSTHPIGVGNNLHFHRSFYSDYGIDVQIPVTLVASKGDFWVPGEYAEKWADSEFRRLESIEDGHNVLVNNPELVLNVFDRNYSFIAGETV